MDEYDWSLRTWDEKALDILVVVAWIWLIMGIIGGIGLWVTIGTNFIGIFLGFVSIFQGIGIWAFFLTICSMAKNLTIIKKVS